MQTRQQLSAEAWKLIVADVPIIPIHQEPQIFGVLDTVAEFNMRANEDVELRFIKMKK